MYVYLYLAFNTSIKVGNLETYMCMLWLFKHFFVILYVGNIDVDLREHFSFLLIE